MGERQPPTEIELLARQLTKLQDQLDDQEKILKQIGFVCVLTLGFLPLVIVLVFLTLLEVQGVWFW